MTMLTVRYPETGQEISTGIDVDADSFASLPDKLPLSKCPVSGSDHLWLKCGARFSDVFGIGKDAPSR